MNKNTSSCDVHVYQKNSNAEFLCLWLQFLGGVACFHPILSFGSLGCWRTICILELWVLVWNTKTPFWSCYQELSHGIVLFFWKAFGLLAIGELIMSAHPFVPLLMLTLKIMSSLHIMGLEAYALLWTLLHTHLFLTCLLVILFLCGL
jgi:hypothetical protein